MKRLVDLAPAYTETDLTQFPVEPFNTFSNLFFLVVATYWFRKYRTFENKDFKTFLKIGLPLLLTGYVGGTIYHATRSHLAWMLMDVVPIYILGILTSLYHWRLTRISPLLIFLSFLIFLFIPLILLWTFSPGSSNTPTLGYVCLTIPIVLPILIDQFRTRGAYLYLFLRPLFFISLALSARALDSNTWVQQNLPIGTHWVWHTLGAVTCHFLLVFMATRAEDHQ